MANQWFRLYSEFANDPKIQMLSESDQRRFIMVLCIRCSNGDVTLHDEEVAFQLRISNDEWVTSKSTFMAKNLIDSDNLPIAWDKRQYSSDSSAERVRKHREKAKQDCNVTVTPSEQIQNRTDTEQKQIKTKATASRSPVIFPEAIPDQLQKDFNALRKAKKSPVTQTALDGIEREATKAGISLKAALEMCCQRGWAGFKAEWIAQTGPPNQNGQFRSGTSKHDMRANFAEQMRNGKNRDTERVIDGEAERVD